MIEYAGGTEVRLLPEKVAYIERLREGYLGVPSVKKYFRHPARAFDEGLKLNDGGVSYLVEQLTPVCHPELKDEQIRGRFAALLREVLAATTPFYIDSDVEKRLAERQKVSHAILRHVQRLAGQRRFADLVLALQVSDETLSRFIYDAYSRRSTVLAGGKDATGKPGGSAAVPGIPSLPGIPPLPGMAAAPARASGDPAAPRRDTIEAYLARSVIEHWIGLLYTSAETEQLGRFFVDEPKLAVELVNELSNAVRRLRLDDRLAAAIHALAGGLNEEIDTFLEKVCFVSSAILNRFVNEFGYDRVPMNERPQALSSDGVSRPIYAPREAADSASDFHVPVLDHHYEHLVDWMYALHDLIECNVKSVDGLSFDVEQNARLGGILGDTRRLVDRIGAGAS
jgi:hypothetical protein